jgi:hypothetical protein
MDKTRGTRRRRFYFRDPKMPIFAVVAIIGCLYLYGYFSHFLLDFLLGPNPTEEQIYSTNRLLGWGLIFVPAVTFVSLLIVLAYGIQALFRWISRKPLTCPRCGMIDSSGAMRFAQEPVEGSDWKLVTCPRCRNEWHVPR